ncbi:hypothetical protein MMC20_000408 [Loxospora ochrophaea]|nr:hypothetical protein [Loxospora ochrophaea]
MNRSCYPSKSTVPSARAWCLAVFLLVTIVVFEANLHHKRPEYPASTRIAHRPTTLADTPTLPFEPSLNSQISHLQEIQEWQKPVGLKVVGLVFYGRRRFVSILECYLQRNLVENGGLLDEVIFVTKTDDVDDLEYLDHLLRTNPKYSASTRNDTKHGKYGHMWSSCQKGVLYIKMDDDMVFFEDSAIRSIVRRKVENPELLLVSGNIVIQPAFSWVHHHFGAIHPYLPEITASGTDLDGNITITWRTSELPFWMGPPDFDIENFPAPRGHRWLPLPDGTVNDQTPIWASTYEAFGASLKNWAIGAQQHYSFLENLEKGELWRYKFDTWDFLYDRFSINLFAISGDDIVAMGPLPEDDEEFLTQIFAKKTGRHAIMDGHSVGVHFSFGPMRGKKGEKGIERTDLLDRYRAYAEESICPK